jgi:hypothetical protein
MGRLFVAVEPLPKERRALKMPQAIAESITIESNAGHYEAEEIAFGVVYRWYPGSVQVQCGCSEVLALTHSLASCRECGANHTPAVREELAGQCPEDEALHPWGYAGDREGYGLPY